MRFTPSTNWSIANSAAYRKIAWTTEVRIVSVLDTALFSGTWTQIDSFIHEIDDIAQRIEHNPGQFTGDSITLTVGNIAWWDTNFLATTDYIEFRRRPSIGIGATMMSTDSANAFHGFIDNREGQLNYSNETDEVTFTVYTPDDIGSRISALNVNTQYINTDIDGAGTDGLILPKIKGVFVQDANIASYVLKKGFHTLTYKYNAGTEQMKLDDGSYTSLPGSDGTVDLVNADGDEKIKLYVDVSLLPTTTEIVDYVIVITAGTTLPRQPYYGVSSAFILRKLYEQIGFTNANVTVDTLQFAEKDSTAQFSYYDIPPQDISKTGNIRAMANDGTYLYIGVGDTVYKRTMTTDSYSVLTTKASYEVKRMWYNARNGQMWIWFQGASTNYVRIYTFASSGSTDVDVSSTSHFLAADLIDYEYSAGSWKYGLMYSDKSSGGDIRIINSAGTDTQILTAATMVSPGSGAGAQYGFVIVNSNNVYFQIAKDAHIDMYLIHVYSDGSWTNDGVQYTMDYEIVSNGADVTQFALHVDEGKVYYAITPNANVIKVLTLSDGTLATVETLSASYVVLGMLYANGQIYAMVVRATDPVTRFWNDNALYSLDAGSATLLNSDNLPVTYFQNLTYMGGVLYGIDEQRRLWRYSATLQMYYKHTVWEDTSIKEAINQCLGAYNLIGKISSHKKVNVLRRGNDAGTKQTTGNSIIINNTNCASVQKTENAYPAVVWVEVSNGDVTHSYDGTNFDTAVLSEANTFTISNPLLPDERIKDVAVYFYNFWSVARTTYQFEILGAPMQYEVMDGADVTFADQYVNITSSAGLIIGQTINNFGRCLFDVLF